MSAQLNFFEKEETEYETLKREILEVRQRTDNARRGLFARHNELANLFLKQQQEIDALRSVMLETRKELAGSYLVV